MTREEALKEFIGYQTYDIQPSVAATQVAIEALREAPVQNDISYKIANHVREELDEFIFTVLGDWCGKQDEFINIKVSKEVLKQAILCYIKEHREDYERLLVNMPITKEETK